ncbi:MAG: tRNA (adenosine(37)-N6)-threonylcarbamoyltransferase complex dimerization subunit type 1 TsaB [Candidatus Sumerlaeia bacterium]|nr:tRNA (adenosine(37)-N6)-threonylcarbamoyltransferase complex dimerization subunit type 1 TsaB [Candidatus Sumerlaeia bacterium]
MNLLAFETATPSGGVALLRGGRLAGCLAIRAMRHHSRLVLDLARQLLEVEGLGWGDIDVFAASHGPGSFTGVRISLTHAKAFAFATGKRLVTVDTFAVMASGARDGSAPVLALLDARRGEVYGALFGPDGREPLSPPFCAAPDAVAAHLGGFAAGPLIACGEGALVEGVGGSLPGMRLASEERRIVSPALTALLASERAARGEWADPASAAPVYLRHPIEG